MSLSPAELGVVGALVVVVLGFAWRVVARALDAGKDDRATFAAAMGTIAIELRAVTASLISVAERLARVEARLLGAEDWTADRTPQPRARPAPRAASAHDDEPE